MIAQLLKKEKRLIPNINKEIDSYLFEGFIDTDNLYYLTPNTNTISNAMVDFYFYKELINILNEQGIELANVGVYDIEWHVENHGDDSFYACKIYFHHDGTLDEIQKGYSSSYDIDIPVSKDDELPF